MLYYGDKISKHMTKTPEGYLICEGVPLGRVGTMEYLGNEIPEEFGEPSNKIVRVTRAADSLFNPETIASFEGKPVTNDHPNNNLDVNNINYISRGHVQKVRRAGDYLIGDLYITDAGLINDINNGKREVSSGYDAGWQKNEDGTYSQVGILGNHVAIVDSGRAGHNVCIRDTKENVLKIKQKSGGKKMKLDKNTLVGKILSKFAVDAEPEEMAAASEMLNKQAQDEDIPAEKEKPMTETKDQEPNESDAKIAELSAKIDSLVKVVSGLVQSDKKVHENISKESMDELEKELDNPKAEIADEEIPEEQETLEDENEESPEEQQEEAEEGAEKHVFVVDTEPLKKVVKDMKPKLLAIKDEKLRDELTKQFVKSVRDSKTVSSQQYTDIMSIAKNTRRKKAQDSMHKSETFEQRAAKAAEKWNNYGGKK